MPRLLAILLLLIPVTTEYVASQSARCRLAARPYGFGGMCRLEKAEGGPSQSLRMQIPDSVRIWMTTGPQDPPPWRGNISLPSTEVAFEIAKDRSGVSPDRFIFRTGLTWLPVKEWRQVEPAQPPCAACERLSSDVLLILDLVNAPQASEDDLAILRTALAGLDRIAQWNRRELQSCTSGDQTNTGFFCLLYAAVEARMGRYHHRQPALELVRSVIFERWRDRITSHQLIDFNNHPATTRADLSTALQVALERASVQAQSSRQQDPLPAEPEALFGCWSTSVGRFVPGLEQSEFGWARMPATIRIDTVPGIGLFNRRIGRRIQAVPPADSTVFGDGYVVALEPNTFHLTWTSGFVWVSAKVELRDSSMRGELEAATDVGTSKKAPVRLTRIACP
jgi:hypothetical protein